MYRKTTDKHTIQNETFQVKYKRQASLHNSFFFFFVCHIFSGNSAAIHLRCYGGTVWISSRTISCDWICFQASPASRSATSLASSFAGFSFVTLVRSPSNGLCVFRRKPFHLARNKQGFFDLQKKISLPCSYSRQKAPQQSVAQSLRIKMWNCRPLSTKPPGAASHKDFPQFKWMHLH